MAYTIPVCIATTGILIGWALAALPFDRSGEFNAWLFRFWARSILTITRVRVRLRGVEHIDLSRRYICVANHSSLIDIPVLVASLPLRLCFVAKEELFRIPVFGAYLRRMRHIPVARSNSRAAAKSMADAARAIAAGMRSVLLFPEGGRTAVGEGLREFREGAAYIAIKAGVPVVPVAIVGLRDLLPMGSFHLRAGEAVLHIGDPIPTKGMLPRDRAELTQRLYEELARITGEGRYTVAQAP